MSRLLVVSSILSALLVGCAPDPGAGKVAAKVENPPAAPPPAAAPAPAPAAAARSFKVDVSRSKLKAVGAKITATHDISFGTWSGTASVAGDQLVGLDITADVGSLVSEPEKLVGHLKSPDFFDVATFPTATFKATEIKAGGEGGTHTVSGDLTMRATTKRISFPATIKVAGDQLDAKAEFVINRKDFGIVYPGKPDDLIQDNVALSVELVAAPG